MEHKDEFIVGHYNVMINKLAELKVDETKGAFGFNVIILCIFFV